MIKFIPFPKIARWTRPLIITEKIDGTNAQVTIVELDSEDALCEANSDPYCVAVLSGPENGDSPLALYAGSRRRWIVPEGTQGFPKGCDNFGFARWVQENAVELSKLGPGTHFGEWYGKGIQRGYGLEERGFALFNTARWGYHNPNTPTCCEVVPVFPKDYTVEDAIQNLTIHGSVAVPGFMDPEGICIYHTASNTYYKKTIKDDGIPKGLKESNG